MILVFLFLYFCPVRKRRRRKKKNGKRKTTYPQYSSNTENLLGKWMYLPLFTETEPFYYSTYKRHLEKRRRANTFSGPDKPEQ